MTLGGNRQGEKGSGGNGLHDRLEWRESGMKKRNGKVKCERS